MQRSVRLAGYEDLAGVQRLYKELRPHDPDLTSARASAVWKDLLDSPRMRFVVAEQDGALASTCMLALIANLASGGRAIGFIEHVITLQEFRGQGLARAVVRYALDLAWSQDCCKVVLLSGAQRTEAHRLYESLGFRPDVERGFVIEPG